MKDKFCMEYFQQIDRVMQVMSSLVKREKNQGNLERQENPKRFLKQKQILKQIESLKFNLQNLFLHCQKLENQNRFLKTIVSGQDVASALSHQKQKKSIQNIKNQSLQNARTKLRIQKSYYFEQNEQTKDKLNNTNSNCLVSVDKIRKLKLQVADLSKNLKNITRTYESYQNKSIDKQQRNDLFSTENSLIKIYDSEAPNKENLGQVDLEYLLCHEQLSVDQPSICSKSLSQINDSQLDSLIAKGIQFREQRTLKSKEFQSLHNVISKYRNQAKAFQKPPKISHSFSNYAYV